MFLNNTFTEQLRQKGYAEQLLKNWLKVLINNDFITLLKLFNMPTLIMSMNKSALVKQQQN